MKKDMRFTFRIGSDLKKQLETIAAREGRSVAQICDAFLRAGSESYRKKGPKYLQRFLLPSERRKSWSNPQLVAAPTRQTTYFARLMKRRRGVRGSTLGKRVLGKVNRGFESHPLRHAGPLPARLTPLNQMAELDAIRWMGSGTRPHLWSPMAAALSYKVWATMCCHSQRQLDLCPPVRGAISSSRQITALVTDWTHTFSMVGCRD